VEQERCRVAWRRGLEYLLERARVKRPNGMEMYNVWAFGYTLRALGEILPLVEEAELKERMFQQAQRLIEALEIYQTPDGGWGYYDFEAGAYRPSDSSMSFTTATILLGIHEMAAHGLAVPQKLIQRAVKSLQLSRKEDGSYIYGIYARYRPQAGYNKVKGSLGRSLACHLALRRYTQEVQEEDLRRALESFFRHHHFPAIGRKRPWPHEAWYFTSGYYYYYGVYYASQALRLFSAEESEAWRRKLGELLISQQEKDGSWWDFPLYGYHKFYGTAYALLALEGMRLQ
jgi:hypothetical protein